MTYVHINWTRPDSKFVHAGTCPDCGQWSRFIGWSQEWYGSDKTCLKCGRRWRDGEWMDLPFVRGSRQKSIQQAKDFWRQIQLPNEVPE